MILSTSSDTEFLIEMKLELIPAFGERKSERTPEKSGRADHPMGWRGSIGSRLGSPGAYLDPPGS